MLLLFEIVKVVWFWRASCWHMLVDSIAKRRFRNLNVHAVWVQELLVLHADGAAVVGGE